MKKEKEGTISYIYSNKPKAISTGEKSNWTTEPARKNSKTTNFERVKPKLKVSNSAPIQRPDPPSSQPTHSDAGGTATYPGSNNPDDMRSRTIPKKQGQPPQIPQNKTVRRRADAPSSEREKLMTLQRLSEKRPSDWTPRDKLYFLRTITTDQQLQEALKEAVNKKLNALPKATKKRESNKLSKRVPLSNPVNLNANSDKDTDGERKAGGATHQKLEPLIPIKTKSTSKKPSRLSPSAQAKIEDKLRSLSLKLQNDLDANQTNMVSTKLYVNPKDEVQVRQMIENIVGTKSDGLARDFTLKPVKASALKKSKKLINKGKDPKKK